MIEVTASAPGKVVLCGEYAVLDGAPAICMAVDRRARARVSRHAAAIHTVDAPGYSTARGRFRTAGETFEWLEDGEEFALVEQVFTIAKVPPGIGLALSLDTRAFVDATSGKKIGIGSSAALAVALSAALDAVASNGAGVAADIARQAVAAHRKFQGGAGSGVDVACSVQGGIIKFRLDRDEHRSLHWPQGLAYAILWSGVTAGTGTKLGKLERQVWKPSRAALATAAERAATAWVSGSAARILAAMRAYSDALRKFSVDHDLGIFDAGHAELADAAPDDVVYKPCGAGGGDIGIVVAHSEKSIAAFMNLPAAAGFERLDLSIDVQGVAIVREEH